MGCGSLPYPTDNFQINKYGNCYNPKQRYYEEIFLLSQMHRIILFNLLPYPTDNFQINKYGNCRTNYESLDTLLIFKRVGDNIK